MQITPGKFVWKRKVGPFESGKRLYVGQNALASVDWYSRSKNDNANWKITLHVQNMKAPDVYYEKEEEAKAQAVLLVTEWLQRLGD